MLDLKWKELFITICMIFTGGWKMEQLIIYAIMYTVLCALRIALGVI